MTTHDFEFCYRMRHSATAGASAEPLPAATIDALEGAVLDPALARVVVRVAPYPDMACGDQLLLSWDGLWTRPYKTGHQLPVKLMPPPNA